VIPPRRGEEGWMAHDQRESTSRGAGPPSDAPRVKAVACLGGVSLERGVPVDEIHDYIREADNVLWVDVQDPGPAEIALLIDEFGLHPLALEDAAHGQRRPKADEFKGYLLLVTYAAVPGADAKALRTAEVDLFIGRNYVVSLHRGRVPALEEALTRWMRGGSMLREGVGFLVYAVLDAIIDSFAPVLGGIEDEIDETEIAVLTRSDVEGVRNLLRLKRDLTALRRVLYPLRSVFQVLLRRDHPFFPGNTEVYLREVFEHVLRILDDLETERDRASSALEASLAIGANRLNQTMKTLAVITVAVAVVGSVFGAYGMNFEVLPLAKAPWGFWAVGLGTIALVASALLVGWRLGWW
jgi:magnesium transporter